MFRDSEEKLDHVELELKSGFYKSESDLFSKRLNVSLLLSLVFVSVFAVLDYHLYSFGYKMMWLVRFISFFVIVFILLALKKLKKYTRIVSYFSVLGFYLMINILIYLTDEGASSPYYAGLILAIIALSTVMPWNGRETTFIVILGVGLYLFTVTFYSISYKKTMNFSMLVNNLFFIISTSTFCIIAKFFDAKLRFNQFSLNFYLKRALYNIERVQNIVQNAKLNALGSLSAGLIHEINNPLNYATMAVAMVKDEKLVKENKSVKEYIDDIDEAIKRVSVIVKDLRSFAHPDKGDKDEEFALNIAIERARRFTSSEMKNINFKVDVENDIIVKASQNHIIQVFVNLITNACKAIEMKKVNDGEISFAAEKDSEKVTLTVSDNGVGMSQEAVEKAFEPFFTTKDVGDGLGLGLSICYTILRSHNANIKVESEEGVGTKFILTFPINEK